MKRLGFLLVILTAILLACAKTKPVPVSPEAAVSAEAVASAAPVASASPVDAAAPVDATVPVDAAAPVDAEVDAPKALASTATTTGTMVTASTKIGTSSYSTDWFLPATTPTGLVYLQHAFMRSSSNLRDMAKTFMAQGMMVMAVNVSVQNGNSTASKSFADALQAGTIVPPQSKPLPASFVLAGHSAGGLFVTYMGKRLADVSSTKLKGLVLFDPVDASNAMLPNMQAVITKGGKVLAILSNSSSCNSSNNAMAPLKALSQAFVGIKLTVTSKHTDPEGANSGGLLSMLCGSPISYNILKNQDFASHWASDMLTGNITSAYYPGGTAVTTLVTTDKKGVLIK